MSEQSAQVSSREVGVPSAFVTPEESKLHQVHGQFVHFCAVPDPDKCEMLGIPFDRDRNRYVEIPTIKAFAEKFGVARRTLYNWKNHKEFNNAVLATRREWGKEKTPNIMAALYRRCVTHGMAYDIELWLAYMEGWNRHQVVKVEYEKIDADDIRALLAVLPENERAEFEDRLADLITRAEGARGSAEVALLAPGDTGRDSA